MTGPHQDQQLVTAGTPLAEARAAVVFVHGRGATAQSIVQMGRQIGQDGVAYLAPQAARNTWYPNSFLAPVEQNEPGRTSGLQAVGDAVETAQEGGLDRGQIVLCGFSQGGCLASEFVARDPKRYGGLVAWSGGLIGEEIDPAAYEGSVDGMPAFFGCSDEDPHIPAERVHKTADVFENLDADVTKRLYPGMGHQVNRDELEAAADIVSQAVAVDS
jgi:phospholipase/carboxylesterase